MDSALKQLIPHRPPMVMIDELLESDGDLAKARKVFVEADYAIENSLVAEVALIEGLAQTVAAAFGSKALAEGRSPGVGMLVGVSGFVFRRRVRAGEEVIFEAAFTRRLPPFYLADGRVLVDGEVVAEGSMKFYMEEGGGE